MEASTEKLVQKMRECDFVRWSYPSMQGAMLCKILPSHQCEKFINGKGACPSTVAMGAANEIPEIPALSGNGHPNAVLVPDESTFHVVPWCGGKSGRKVGQVICNWTWCDKRPMMADCRGTAQRQLAALAEQHSLLLKSTFEYEFRLFNPETKKPISHRTDCYSALLAFQNEEFLLDVSEQLAKSGLNVEAIHSELGQGQYEITMSAEDGIRAADNAFLYREVVREVAHKHGLMASFMTTPVLEDSGSGAHFNHSLWSLDGIRNAMHDSLQADNMSAHMRHWIAGLQRHGRALAAFCSPTVNCYRRLHGEMAPDWTDWDIDNRGVTYRAKLGDDEHPSNTYLENRQPSSAINAYAVLAATVAAGLDGLRNKLLPTEPGDRTHCEQLPQTLAEAVDALKEDTVLVELLGQEFVEWYVAVKEQVDIEKFGHHDLTDNSSSKAKVEFQDERDEYLVYL